MSKKIISKNDFMKKIDSAPKHAMSLERKCISKEDLIKGSMYAAKIIGLLYSLFLESILCRICVSALFSGGEGIFIGLFIFVVAIVLYLFMIRGLCKSIIKTHIALKDFKNGNFTIYEEAATGKRRERVKSRDNNHDTYYFIRFVNHDEIQVSFSDYDDINIGDVCYIIENNTDKKTRHLFPKWKYQLPYEWRYKIKKD